MIPPKQKKFLESFEGMSKGKYHNTTLAIIRLLGGKELRQAAQAKYGRPNYQNDEMYPTSEEAYMVFHAAEQGVPLERIGFNIAKTYLRSVPEISEIITTENAGDIICQAYSNETDYGQSIKVVSREPNRAVIERCNNPLPCECFIGTIRAVFDIIDKPVQIRETKCQWKDESKGCVFEYTWE
jgi:hypothetical protein